MLSYQRVEKNVINGQLQWLFCKSVQLGQKILLVDLREFFSDLVSGGWKNKNKKALKMTSWLVIFRAF